MQSQSQLTHHTAPSPHTDPSKAPSQANASKAKEALGEVLQVPQTGPEDTADHREQRFVLTRLMGRPDLTNNFSWLVPDELEPGRTRDLRDLLDEQMRLEVIRGRQTIDSACWVQSDECWICDRWGYLLSMVTKTDIEDC